MSLRSIALVLCVAAFLGCSSSEVAENEAATAGTGGAGAAPALDGAAAASGQGGVGAPQAGMGSVVAGGVGGDDGAGQDAGELPDAQAHEPVDAAVPDSGPSAAERAAADQETLLACGAAETCAATTTGMIENLYAYPPAADFECLFTALAERKPGLYEHQTSHSFTNGSWQVAHTLLVREDGTALYTRVGGGSLGVPPDWEPMTIEGSAPGLRCALKPASYFEDCLAALETTETEYDQVVATTAWSCVFGGSISITPPAMPWLESCEDASPLACE
jgi:hypothetical protein